jgi:HK97 family phage major capsid protein
MDLIDVLRAQRRARYDQRQAAQAELDSILEGPAAENRDLNEDEAARFDAVRRSLDEHDTAIGQLDERIAAIEDAQTRERAARESAERFGDTREQPVRVTNEPRTYSAEAERRGVSFFRDLINRHDDPAAEDRIRRHLAETADVETRDVGTGAFTGLVVPQYLTDLVAPLRRAGRPVADIANAHPLPSAGMTVNISRITTGTAVAAQATENSAVQETDADDTLLTVNVRTIAGQQDVSRQAIDRGTGIDTIVLEDLVRAYNTELDRQILNADGTSGTHLGIRSTSGIVAVTYTDASPTAAELYPKLADLIQQIQAAVFLGISHFVMHPRRWWWIAKELGTSFPLVQFPGTAPQVAGNAGDTSYEAMNRQLFGVPVVLDGNIPTNLGAGTNEDVILGVTASELHLWEEPNAPLTVRAEQTQAGSLTVKLVVFGYSAFTAGRYPSAHGTISGTGLVTPTF